MTTIPTAQRHPLLRTSAHVRAVLGGHLGSHRPGLEGRNTEEHVLTWECERATAGPGQMLGGDPVEQLVPYKRPLQAGAEAKGGPKEVPLPDVTPPASRFPGVHPGVRRLQPQPAGRSQDRERMRACGGPANISEWTRLNPGLP